MEVGGSEEGVKGVARSTMLFNLRESCRREVYGRGSGQTPLHWAAESNHAAVVSFLTSAAPLLAEAIDERGRTARALAVREGAAVAEAMLLAAEAVPLVMVEVGDKEHEPGPEWGSQTRLWRSAVFLPTWLLCQHCCSSPSTSLHSPNLMPALPLAFHDHRPTQAERWLVRGSPVAVCRS